MKKRYLMLLCPLLSLHTLGADSPGWSANPETVALRSEQRPEFNYKEENVPDFTLPNLLETPEGDPITTPEAWEKQRENLLEIFREDVYGRSPGLPDSLQFEVLETDAHAMSGEATLKRIKIRSEVADREHEFEVTLFIPNKRSGPAPLFLLLNNRDRDQIDPTREKKSDFWPAEDAITRGYAIAAFQLGDVAPIHPELFREGVIRLFEGDLEKRPANAWGALAAWAWGTQRVMDYFEQDDDIDAGRVAVLGHSRGGKASLWTGAQDERFALTISNDSGCGGAALSRRRFGETVARINRNFPYWFCDNFNKYNDKEEALPIDQHSLISLLAPRAVYVASADADLWADPKGEFQSLAHASPVYALYGHELISPEAMPPLDTPAVSGPRGYHIRSGGHNLTAYDWQHYMDLADQVFK